MVIVKNVLTDIILHITINLAQMMRTVLLVEKTSGFVKYVKMVIIWIIQIKNVYPTLKMKISNFVEIQMI